ncbi:MAG: peptidylprolyl isomerase [Bacteroidota bacterium]|nr:peptidylprolyl isomerase [Bacteroidota bacterium]MDP4232726.1 peptidylprolyl isomerase [Bacteroidota bacterium]MDP4243141.1 peptidylprolyl isomerase [Bacteroidota bacterium]MDP4287598.1 peptidylprolyl isomerase [Bacteroidota bacterium]
MRFSRFFLLIFFGLTIRAAAQAPVTLKEGQRLDAVVAVVGRHPILKSSIEAQAQLFVMQRGMAEMPADSMMRLRRQILDMEIDQKVALAKADEDSITVTDAEIDQALDQRIKSYVARFGSESAVEKAFGQSISELKSTPSIRDRTRETILVQKEQEKSMPRVQNVSRQDVAEFYNLYKDSLPTVGAGVELATIVKLITPQGDQKQRSLAFARSLVDSLHHGADFAELARRYSQHSTAASGGDLGAFFPRGTFLPAFEEAAFALKPGEVSNVVTTEQGYHIIKLLERRGEEIHVAQILIKPTVSSVDEAAARDSLELIRARAMNGEDFAKLASTYSDDPETRSFGGSLGRIRLEDLAAEQRAVVDSLKEGEVCHPVKIAYSGNRTGWQIVKVLRHIPEHKVSLDEDYRDLEAAAIQWKQSQEAAKWLAAARKTVYISIHDLAQYY